MQETRVQSLGREDPLEKKMTTYCSILAWEISWTEELLCCGLWNHKRVTHNLVTKQQFKSLTLHHSVTSWDYLRKS